MKFIALLSFATAALTANGVLASSQPGPGVSDGSLGQSHDPAIIRRESDGKYFKFSTNNWINAESADSIEGPWTLLGSTFPQAEHGTLKTTVANLGNLWAPDVHKVGEYYYMYYALASDDTQTSAIAVARSKTMDLGDWEDLGSTGITAHEGSLYNAIDPNMIEVDGEYYLNFGSFWNDLYQVKLKSNLVEADGDPYQISFQPDSDHAEEGMYMHQNGDYYYLFYSAGACCDLDGNPVASGKEYRIKVCRSTKYDSGFVDQSGTDCLKGGGTVVLSSHSNVYAPGGQGVFIDAGQENKTILYYHYADLTLGKGDGDKKLGWNVLDFSTGWPVPQDH